MTNSYSKPNEESDDGESGGNGSDLPFIYRDPLSGPQRDDLLPENDKKRLLQEHQVLHAGYVIKQKQAREQRSVIKANPQAYFQTGLIEQGFSTAYKTHPISRKAQFAGIDKQNNFIPTENLAETNQDKREELQLQFRLQHQPEYAPAHRNRLQLRRY